MIKCELGRLEIKGKGFIILSDIEEILRGAREVIARALGEEDAKDILEEVFANAMKSDEELEQEYKDMKIPEFLKKKVKEEMLKELFEKCMRGEDEDE